MEHQPMPYAELEDRYQKSLIKRRRLKKNIKGVERVYVATLHHLNSEMSRNRSLVAENQRLREQPQKQVKLSQQHDRVKHMTQGILLGIVTVALMYLFAVLTTH